MAMLTIQVDSREKAHIIQPIIDTFDERGVKWFISKLPVGDYMSLDNPMLVVDRKHNLQECVGNVCQGHKRFVAELEKANDLGIKLIILIEHSRSIRKLEDVIHWNNPRLKVSPLAVSGERLYKIMYSLQKKYGIEWQFCEKRNTGKRIIEILGGDTDE